MPNELDWTGTPQSAPLGQDGPIMQDDVKELCERLTHCSDNTGDEYLHELTGRAAATIARLSAENEALKELLSCAVDDYEGESGRIIDPDSPHWSVTALKALEGTQHG